MFVSQSVFWVPKNQIIDDFGTENWLVCGLQVPPIPALILIEILSKKRAKLSTLLLPFEGKYFLSEEVDIQIKNGDADKKIDSIRQRYYKSAIVNELDGLSVEFDDWHFNLRKSNTEPLIRLNLEARSYQMMTEKLVKIIKLIGS